MKKGFATSGILYTILLLFVALLFGVLQNLQNKKTILDRLKAETVNALNCDCNQINQDILELKQAGNWKLLKEVTGKTEISLANIEYQELFVVVTYGQYNFPYTIPKIALTNSTQYFFNGSYKSYGSSEIYAYYTGLQANLDKINLDQMTRNYISNVASDITSSAKVTCYYR